MERKRASLASFFTRSSTHTSNVSTPSASRSQSPSPTSSFFVDHDPFAKLDSPVSTRNPFCIPPSTTALSRIESPESCPRVAQPSHGRYDSLLQPLSKLPKLVHDTPSLSSLSELALSDDRFHPSGLTDTPCNAVGNRFPVEPWNLPEDPQSPISEPQDDSEDSELFRSREHPVFCLESRPTSSRPVPERESSALEAHATRCECLHSHADNLRHKERHNSLSIQDLEAWRREQLGQEFPWAIGKRGMAHNSKDERLEGVIDTEGEGKDPTRAPALSSDRPMLLQAAWPQDRSYHGTYRGSTGAEEGTPSDYGSDDYGSDSGGKQGGSGANGDDRGDDDGDENRARSAFSDDQDSESEVESAGDDSEDSEDDVPLAQRIPGALQAQRSIRIQDKADKERKRRERQANKQNPRAQPALPQSRGGQPRPGPIAIEDLTQRLLHVQGTPTSASLQQEVSSPASTSQRTVNISAVPTLRRPVVPRIHPQARQKSQDSSTASRTPQETPSAPLSRQTTSARPRNKSFSHIVARPSSPSRSLGLVPATAQQPLSRNTTTAHRRQPSSANDAHFPPTRVPSHDQELLSPQTGWQRPHEAPTHAQLELERRRSHDVPEQCDTAVVRARTMSSSAMPPQRVLHRARTSGPPPPPVPAMPPLEVKRNAQDVNTSQHRVFIGDMQRFNTIEIGPQTRASDVLDLVEAQGELRGEAAAQPGGWMLWEIAQDFGMERPLRDYELPTEVYASWNSNTRLNVFLIKKTPLAPILARKAMPSSSPTFSGHIQWESRRGKWNKRWMELREHSLWLSKRDNGKDSTFLCSLSNFDGYFVSRLHKAPKPFVFAVKSTDNLTLFENPADYLHVFACDKNDGQRWMERILLARSYVLYKERTVLFSAAAPSSSAAATSSFFTNQSINKALTSSRVPAPLVNVNALQAPVGPPAKSPFQSGSLLAKTSV